MTNSFAIKVEDLSKVYQKKTKDGKQEDFYALKDVNFEVKKGEVIGIIGKNGSGKSTLLKILSGITKPTTGSIEINGTVASILDVGTGFHPDLSGRDNVYLRGELLGMTRKEINEVFDEIVDFSEIGEFIETSVKNYSSGMFLRLAFSIVIILKCDILVLDEVLSVGDLGFKGKSNSAINKLIKNKEKTIIFVSHDMNQFKSLHIKSIIFIEKGNVSLENEPNKILDSYTNSNLNLPELNNQNFIILANKQELEISNFNFNNSETQTLSFQIKSNKECNLDFALLVHDQNRSCFLSLFKEDYSITKQNQVVKVSFSQDTFYGGYFFINLVLDYKINNRIEIEDIYYFNVKPKNELIRGQLKLNTTWH